MSATSSTNELVMVVNGFGYKSPTTDIMPFARIAYRSGIKCPNKAHRTVNMEEGANATRKRRKGWDQQTPAGMISVDIVYCKSPQRLATLLGRQVSFQKCIRYVNTLEKRGSLEQKIIFELCNSTKFKYFQDDVYYTEPG